MAETNRIVLGKKQSVQLAENLNDLMLKTDKIVERILTLGETLVHSYSRYINESEIKEIENMSDGRKTVGIRIDQFRGFVAQTTQDPKAQR